MGAMGRSCGRAAVVIVACVFAIVLACAGCAGGSSNTKTQGGVGNGAVEQNDQKPLKQNDSFYDATKSDIELTGTIVREAKTTDDTGMGWSAVVYWLVLDNSVTIKFNDTGGPKSKTFSRISVYQMEQYESNANVGLSDIASVEWQPYVGKRVTVAGEIINTGTAHTFGYAKFKDARLVS